MKRSYVPIFKDKKYNAHIFFDYETNEFFTTQQDKMSSIVYLSGFVGVVYYSFLSSVSFDTGLTPFTVVLLSILIGAIIGSASMKLLTHIINKSLKTKKIVLSLTPNQVKKYLNESKKQYKSMIFVWVSRSKNIFL